MKFRLLIPLFGVLLGGLLLQPAGAARKQTADVQKIGNYGRIDWSHGVIKATGLGVISNTEPNAAKAYLKARAFAKLDALRNLLMAIDHVRIDSETVGADFQANDKIRAEVNGIVRGAQMIGEREVRYKGSGMVEVTVATAMYGDGGLANVFLPEVNHEESSRASQPEAAPSEEDTETTPVAPADPSEEDVAPAAPVQRYTSVIIDTRGFKIERSMAPKIRRADGGEVWGTVKADPNFVIEQGIVVYARSMSEAKAIDRAGSNPLVLKAVARGAGRFPSDAILSDEDASLLLSADRKEGFLRRYKVIFIVDPARPLP